MTYRVTKHYDSKNKTITEKTGLSEYDAQLELDMNERLWRKHGGIVHDRTSDTLIVEESDGSETITWKIEQEEDNE